MADFIELRFGRLTAFGGIEIHTADALRSPFPLRLLQ